MLNRFVNRQSLRFFSSSNQWKRFGIGDLFKTNRDDYDDDSLDREVLVLFHLRFFYPEVVISHSMNLPSVQGGASGAIKRLVYIP